MGHSNTAEASQSYLYKKMMLCVFFLFSCFGQLGLRED